MFLETLKVCDFRVFEGEHVLELNPQIKWERKRPIVLFGGLNGAGKLVEYLYVHCGPVFEQKVYYIVSGLQKV